MTPRGYEALRNQLLELKGLRVEIARAIETARGHGDLSENGDYHAAKEHSAMTEAKIRDLEATLSMAEVIDPRKIGSTGKVVFGVSVKVVDIEADEERSIAIVGAEESDVVKGMISFESPLGKSLIGKEVGDVVTVNLPSGTKEYEVLEIFIDYK